MTSSQLPLRQYLEMINKECHLLGREELLEIILGLAKEIQPTGRRGFLQKLSALSPTGRQQGESSQDATEKVLAAIKRFRNEIMARITAIEDGSYWDDPDEMDEEDWQRDYYSDDDPDMLNAYQMSALLDFFGEADHLFFHGEKTAAEKIYGALLSLVNQVEEFGALPDSEIELHEIRARFARCVYQLSSEKERVRAMMVVMDATQVAEEFEQYFSRKYPLLRDVIDADTGDLESFDAFLTSWKTVLGKCSFTARRTAELLLEATYMDNGVAAVGKLARKWREKQPLGYLFWLEKLEAQESWQDLRDGAIEALKSLPLGENRRAVSNYLITAGEKMGEDKIILTGYREKFNSKPSENYLLDLVAEARRQQLREEELEKIIEICSEQKQSFGGEILRTKALLMAGKVDQAFQQAEETRAVGWSNSSTGLLFASALYLLTDGNKSCSLIDKQLREYSESIFYFDSFEPNPRASTTSCFDEIIYGLNLTDKSALDLSRLRKWAGTIGENRINHIVSNKHRRAYGRAATVLGSLAELMIAAGDKKKAANLLHEYCKVLYNRHVAFRREVKTAVGRSEILREIRGEL